MLAGDPTVRSYNASSLSQQAVQFVCLDYAGSGAGYGPSQIPPDHSCPDGLRTQIFFPSCVSRSILFSSMMSDPCFPSIDAGMGSTSIARITSPMLPIPMEWIMASVPRTIPTDSSLSSSRLSGTLIHGKTCGTTESLPSFSAPVIRAYNVLIVYLPFSDDRLSRSTLYGYHGDFLNGWDVPSLEAAIAGCTQDSGYVLRS
jgi:hypothetical protein